MAKLRKTLPTGLKRWPIESFFLAAKHLAWEITACSRPPEGGAKLVLYMELLGGTKADHKWRFSNYTTFAS